MTTNEKRNEYVIRDAIQKLLSDDEIARVSAAETEARLMDGDEYVDLTQPHEGVRKALGAATAAMGHVLPRKAVHEKTWHEIVMLLSANHAEGLRSPTT